MPSTRRSFLAASVTGLGSLAGCFSSAEPNANGAWTRRTVDNERTGHATTDGPTTDLHPVWTRAVLDRNVVRPSPVVDDGVLYLAYSRETWGDERGGAWIAAFDAATGDSRWTTELFRSDEFYYFPHSDSTVLDSDRNRLFVQTKPGLTMLTTDGTVQWRFDNLYRGQQMPDIVTPVVTDDAVVTGTYDSEVEDAQDEIVYGVDPATGNERWRTEFPERTGMWQLSGTDDVVYVPFVDDALVALEIETGAERWQWEGPIAGTPTVTDGLLLVPLQRNGEGTLLALDRTDRSKRWQASIGARWTDAGLAVADGRVFLIADFALEARRLETGERIWRFGGDRDEDGASGPQFNLRSTPVVSGGAVYVPGYLQRETVYGHLFVVDAATGEERGRVELGRNEDADMTTPAITPDLAFLATNHGNLYAFGECEVDAAGYCLLD